MTRTVEFSRSRPVDEIRYATGESTRGPILVARSRRGLCAILFGDHRQVLVRRLLQRFPDARPSEDDPGFGRVLEAVADFLAAPEAGIGLPLDLRGTAFQRAVWQAVARIPAGSTVTYGEIARRIGRPRAARAVGGACAANVLAVAVPCHRVVRSDGQLAGYRWGVARKRDLLRHEGGR